MRSAANSGRQQHSGNRVVYLVFGRSRYQLNTKLTNLLRLRSEFKRLVLVSHGTTGSDAQNAVVSSFPNPTGLLRVFGLRRAQKLIDQYLFFPSKTVLYVRRARWRLLKCIKNDLRDGCSVTILTTVPPHDVCSVGLEVKRKLPHVRWVVDWRDLWSYDANYFYRVPRLYRKRLLRLEKRVLHGCDINVTTNEYARSVLVNDYEVPVDRVVSINQHFDRGNFTAAPLDAWVKPASDGRNGVTTLAFMGTLFKPPRVPGSELVRGIRWIRGTGTATELHVYGGTRGALAAMPEGAGDGVVLHENISHEECLERLAEHHFLVLLLSDEPNSKAVMSLKLPHYLSVARPILAIVPEPSLTADVVRKTGAGYVITFDADWIERLATVLREYKNGAPLPPRDESAIGEFSWNNVRKVWREVIDPPHGRL